MFRFVEPRFSADQPKSQILTLSKESNRMFSGYVKAKEYGYLEVPMDYVLLMQILDSQASLVEEGVRFSFSEAAFASQILKK